MTKYKESVNNIESDYDLIKVYKKAHDWDALIGITYKLLKNDPENPGLYIELADAYSFKYISNFASGSEVNELDWDYAITAYDYAIMLAPDDGYMKKAKVAAIEFKARFEITHSHAEESLKNDQEMKAKELEDLKLKQSQEIMQKEQELLNSGKYEAAIKNAYNEFDYAKAIKLANDLLLVFCEGVEIHQVRLVEDIVLNHDVHCVNPKKWYFTDDCQDGSFKSSDSHMVLCQKPFHDEL